MELKFYHGTSSANAESIKQIGIIPQYNGGNWNDIGGTNPGYVYLTNSTFDYEWHAERVSHKDGSDPVVLEVRVDNHELLYPDDNYIHRKLYPLPWVDSLSRAKHFRTQWKKSLDEVRYVAHYGPIKTENIISIKPIR